jgi:hypothetical protein
MAYNNNKYIVMNVSEVDESIDFSQLNTKGVDSARKNNDGTKIVLRSPAEVPSFLNGKTVYSHEEMINKLKESEWIEPDPLGI